MSRRGAACALGGVALSLAVVACGLGWLYLLRQGHLLRLGPRVDGALALQQLALDDGQPLARALAAWLAAGVAAGALMRALDPRALIRILPAFALGGAAWLVLAGAASDALANNAQLSAQLAPQLRSPALAVALGALLAATLAGVAAAAVATRR